MSDIFSMAREAVDYQPQPPIVDISKEVAWDLARRLGFDPSRDKVMSILLRPSDIIVTTAKLNEHGQMFHDPEDRTNVATNVYRYRYSDWSAASPRP